MGPAARKRFPRIAAVAVTVVALAVIVSLATLVWRADQRARPPGEADGEITVMTDGEAEGAGFTFQICTDCHQDLDKSVRESQVLVYSHEKHFATGVADCSVCHPQNTHEVDKVNTPTMGGCFTCHGSNDEAIAPGTCTTCHPPGMTRKPPSHDSARWVSKEHPEEALEDRFVCLTCHNSEEFCTSCHGIEMPHPTDWAEVSHVQSFFDDPDLCQNCHPRAPGEYDSCDGCHHPEGPKGTPWVEVHSSVVRSEGVFTCFDCHVEQTCSACHVRQVETFEADEPGFTYETP